MELQLFYEFSYGAVLGEYIVFTIPEILSAREELQSIYTRFVKQTILPIAYLRDVGDYIVFDLDYCSSEGFLILDGFHETSPNEWKGICYGLKTWLERMTANDFQPFWLKG